MLKKFKSGDETWLHYYDVPTKSQSEVWVFKDKKVPLGLGDTKKKYRLLSIDTFKIDPNEKVLIPKYPC